MNSRVRGNLAVRIWILLILATAFVAPARADQPSAYGQELEGFEYPFTPERFSFPSQGQTVSMTFMDVAPDKTNGRAVLLLHGKNFCAATWEGTITALAGAGYRVIAPDQIGFCKSTKPEHYQYSFQQLAENTHALLMSRNIERAIVVGLRFHLLDELKQVRPEAVIDDVKADVFVERQVFGGERFVRLH